MPKTCRDRSEQITLESNNMIELANYYVDTKVDTNTKTDFFTLKLPTISKVRNPNRFLAFRGERANKQWSKILWNEIHFKKRSIFN